MVKGLGFPRVSCLDWRRGLAEMVPLGVLFFGASPGVVGAVRLRLITESATAS